MEPLFSPEAGDVLDELEKDASNTALVDAIWDALDLISEHPGSAQARHRGLRTAGGQPVWLVPVRGQYHDEVWVVLWQPRDDDALIAYTGPADFRPRLGLFLLVAAFAGAAAVGGGEVALGGGREVQAGRQVGQAVGDAFREAFGQAAKASGA